MSAVPFFRSNLTRKIMSHTIAPEVKNHDLYELNHSRPQSHPVIFFKSFCLEVENEVHEQRMMVG